MKATIDQLTSISIFANLKPEQIALLQSDSEIREYKSEETIMQEGDRLPAKLYAVAQGQLRVIKTATTGKETILRTLNVGEIFAAPALFGDLIAPAMVIAEGTVQVLNVKREALLNAIQANPEIALKMMAVLNHRLQQLHETVHGLVSERAIVRLARLIQETAIEQQIDITQSKTQSKVCLDLQSHYYIARRIGITHEESARLFKQLNAIVSYRRGGKVTVIDGQALNKIAQGSIDL